RRAQHDDGRRGPRVPALAPRRVHPAAVVHRPAGDLGPDRHAGRVAARRSARRRALPRVGVVPRRREARGGRRGRGARREPAARLNLSLLYRTRCSSSWTYRSHTALSRMPYITFPRRTREARPPDEPSRYTRLPDLV